MSGAKRMPLGLIGKIELLALMVKQPNRPTTPTNKLDQDIIINRDINNIQAHGLHISISSVLYLDHWNPETSIIKIHNPSARASF